MTDYDFKALNDKEFEVLCTDLLSHSLGRKIERFKPGRDQGVDGRYFADDGKEIILQCKHWAGTPLSQLINSLEKSEKQKIQKLKPRRYILAISNKLSRLDKKKISLALAPFIISENDIFGCEDLNDIIRNNPKIERQHYKLWLQSSAVLDNIINSAIFGRSKETLNDIREKSRLYVITENHVRALKKLDALGVIIVTGAPGIGKSTLAEHLCIDYVAKDYEFIQMTEDIAEGEAVLDSDSKQIYYFDDFLGRNYLEALTGHEGSKIATFIRRIRKNKNKKFVLTSRSTILNQGKILIDVFYHENTEQNEYELKIDSLKPIDKARILYNHIWHSNLGPDYIDALYIGKNYIKIIEHKNYNPRIISYITDSSRLSNIESAQYWNFVERSLSNPAHIWENPFVAQQDDFGRAIVLLTVLESQRISEAKLSDAFANYISLPENQNMKGRRDFKTNIKSLSGTFLNRFLSQNNSVAYDLFNPSIGDFVVSHYSQDRATLKNAFCSLRTVGALQTLKSLQQNRIISDNDCEFISSHVLDRVVKEKNGKLSIIYLSELLIYTLDNAKNSGLNEANFEFCLSAILNNKDDEPISENCFDAVARAIQLKLISEKDALKYVQKNFQKIDSDEGLSACAKILAKIDNTVDGWVEIADGFDEFVREYITGNLSEFVDPTEAFQDVSYGEVKDAQEKIINMIEERLISLGLNTDIIDNHDFFQYYDVEDGLEGYFRNEYDGDDRDDYISQNSEGPGDAIADLFDRS